MSNNLLVLQSDFGLVDGAVSAMIGVALQESRDLVVHNPDALYYSLQYF